MSNFDLSSIVVKCENINAGYVRRRQQHSPNPTMLFRLLEMRHAVGPFSHNLRPGELVGIIGDNGAGKSTLLKALASSIPLISGNIWSKSEPASIIELGSPNSQWITGREYVKDYFRLSSIMRTIDESIVDLVAEAERFSRIGSAFVEPIITYSSGMLARVLFAAALAGSTPYILLDEVLSVGDTAFTARCWRHIRQKLEAGMCGFLVTHDWKSVLRLCKHSIWIDKGQVVHSSSPQQVISAYLNQGLTNDETLIQNLALGNYVYDDRERNLSLGFTFVDICSSPLEIAVSIESVGQGLGWQIIALTDFQPLIVSSTRKFSLQLKPLNLANGNYEACVFVKCPDREHNSSQTYSWFTGSSFSIDIKGGSDHFLSSDCVVTRI